MSGRHAPDVEALYLGMLEARLFEEAIAGLWKVGRISGELHLGTGEEAIAAGTVSQLVEGDALSVDYRSTPPLLMRGIDPVAMILELMGSNKGLCKGRGGHMHLFSRDHLAASSGIVGASVAMGAGFALAASHLRKGNVALAFLGEGAMNQGMSLETLNLAVAWKLPLVLVCKDNRMAITTRSRSVTGGGLVRRARAFGMPASSVNGLRVDRVWKAAWGAIARARAGKGPSFILARCVHLDGHFLGDPMIRVFSEPLQQAREISGPLIRSAIEAPGAGWGARAAALGKIASTLGSVGAARLVRRDPLRVSGRLLEEPVREQLEETAAQRINDAVLRALYQAGTGGDMREGGVEGSA